jgi:hypothetical protein
MPDNTPAAPAPLDPWSATSDQINAELGRIHREMHPPPSVVPQDAQEARMQLDMLSRVAVLSGRGGMIQ